MSVRWAFNFSCWQPTRDDWQKAICCLQMEERERVNQFVYKKDAKAALAGRLLMRKVIHEKTSIPYRDISLGRTENGKPYLLTKLPASVPPTFNFNVSHQGDYAVLAAEPYHAVGVDVMKVERAGSQPVPEFFRLMKRQFTADEWSSILRPAEEPEQLALFYRHWCLKESYLKSRGIGIGFGLKRLSFHLRTRTLQQGVTTSDTTLYLDEKRVDNYRFDETLLDVKHCVAVATSDDQQGDIARSPPSLFEELTIGQLLREATPLLELDPCDWSTFENKEE